MSTTSKACLTLSLALLAAPALATGESGVDLSLHLGGDQYDAVSLKSGLGGVSGAALLDDGSRHLGATLIYWKGLGEVGVIGEVGRPGQDGATTLLGLLAGLGFGTGPLRLELLGELATHKYGDVLADAAVVSRSRTQAWLVSVGLRPGLAIHFGPNDMLLLGVWGFARWDVTSEDVQVTLNNGLVSTYELGGTQFGASLRAGIRL